MPFSLSSVAGKKLVMAGFLVVVFATVGFGSRFMEKKQNETPQPVNAVRPAALTLAGRGSLPPLDAAMGKDDHLRQMVGTLAMVPATQVFLHGNDVDNKVAAILFRWAGADTAQKETNGPYIDARVVAFLKRTGLMPETKEGSPPEDIDIKQAAALEQLWFKAFEHYRVPLLAQTAARGVYDGDVHYDPATDKITVSGGVSPRFTKAFDVALQKSNNSGENMRALLDFIDATKGFSNLSDKEQDLIMGISPPKAQPITVPPGVPDKVIKPRMNR